MPLTITVLHQACDDQTCLLPATETLTLDVPLEVVDMPNIAMHRGHGQRLGNYDGTRHLLRLVRRKVLPHPLGFLRYIRKHVRLELAARRRRRAR